MKVIPPIITVDGPSGAGKGALCKALVEILQWHLLDSGAIYRTLALSLLHHKLASSSEQALALLAMRLDIRLAIKSGKINVMLEGKDVSQAISNETVGRVASTIASYRQVRKALLQRQRAFHSAPGLIADGRDMGTVVFPDAPVKIFLEASLEERAYRRMRQLQERGFSVSFRRLLSDIKERDDCDRNRLIAPLIPPVDALVLDSTYLSIDEVATKVLAHAKKILVSP